MGVPNVKSNHIGSKIVRIRELKGIKQETLAATLGISQQAVSKMEQSKSLDDDKLKSIADALSVTTDAIKNFNEDAIINNISCNFTDNAINTMYQFNPLEKMAELYESLLALERKKVEELEKKFADRK